VNSSASSHFYLLRVPVSIGANRTGHGHKFGIDLLAHIIVHWARFVSVIAKPIAVRTNPDPHRQVFDI
jgi:hypothetical protein